MQICGKGLGFDGTVGLGFGLETLFGHFGVGDLVWNFVFELGFGALVLKLCLGNVVWGLVLRLVLSEW